jgi:capsular polysaccharide biosynthesis protein
MPDRSESKAVKRSCQIFRRLLVAYPKAHREEYGTAILQLFRDQCRDAWSASRGRGLIGFWLHALSDLLKTSVLEHLANVNRRKFMFNFFRSQPKSLIIFGSVFMAVFLLATGGSIFITLICPKTYASTARIMVNPEIAKTSSTSSYDPQFMANQIAIIQSHAVLSKASEALDLRRIWGKKYNNGQSLNESEVEDIIKSRLELNTIRQTTSIEIRAFGDSPDETAKLANSVAEAYRDFRRAEAPQNGAVPIVRRVSMMETAVPNPKPVRPNTPLNIILGVMIGVFMGGLSGTVAVVAMWFLGRRPGNAASPSRSASSDITA